MRVIRDLLALIGAVVMTILLVGYVFIKFVYSSSESVNIEELVQSPNSELNAVVYTVMGGGAAGYCDKYIAISNVIEKPEKIDSDTEYVFEITCRAELHLAWLDNNKLSITYSAGVDNGVYVSALPAWNDGKVKLFYTHANPH